MPPDGKDFHQAKQSIPTNKHHDHGIPAHLRQPTHTARRQPQPFPLPRATQLMEPMRRNTDLTETTKTLSERIQSLTEELHHHLMAKE